VITGFNTDIEHDGVVYHVQTEDKGLDSPIILSLVYAGGTILASKRSPYDDLIAEGFSDEALSERLKRQHRLICAAIHSGRIHDLKKMSGRAKVAPAAPLPSPSQEVVDTTGPEALPEVEETLEAVLEIEETPGPIEETFEIEYWPMTQEWTPPPPAPPREEIVADESEMEPQYQPVEAVLESAEAEEVQELEAVPESVLPDGLYLNLLDDEEFYSGKRYTLRVQVTNRTGGDEKPLSNVGISIKVLGTTFRPLIYTLKSESDGVASVSTEMPHFTSGRAAVLVRAVARDQAAELRRIIHPAS
jgi:hypothetical protein